MIEVVISVFMTAVAIMAIFSLVSPAWNTVSRSDYLGRASGILYEQLMMHQARIMNPCCTVTAGALPPFAVYTSGPTTSLPGDVTFNVATTVTNLLTTTPSWRVTVNVTWAGNATGITESILVIRQDGFTFPENCTAGALACQ